MTRFNRLELDLSPRQQTQAPALHTQATSSAQLSQDEKDFIHLADESRRNGHFENALRYYSRALELDKSLAIGWVGQVQMLIALQEYPEADLWARKALELFKTSGDLMSARAQALCRAGDLKQSQALCDAALSQQGCGAYGWIVRGELMLARRDPIERHCFDKAIQLDADWLVLIEIAGVYAFYKLPAKAIERARQATERAPHHAYCWYQQGCIEMQLGLIRPATLSFKRCLEISPKHEDARRYLDAIQSKQWSTRSIFRRLFTRR